MFKTLPLIIALISLCSPLCFGEQWATDFAVDDFGDKSSQRVIHTRVTGVFENTATNGDKCLVDVLVHEALWGAEVSFRISEYEQSPINPELWEKLGKTYLLRVKDDKGVEKSYLLKGDRKRLVFAQDRDRPISTPLTSRTHFVTQLMTMKELKCVISLAGSSTRYQFKIPLDGFRKAADPIMGSFKKREAEKEEQRQMLEAAAQKMADERIAEKKAKDEIARKRKEPMLFETKDKQFSTRGLFMGSTRTHVRLKRSDNGKDVTVEKSLLSEGTISEISLRESN